MASTRSSGLIAFLLLVPSLTVAKGERAPEATVEDEGRDKAECQFVIRFGSLITQDVKISTERIFGADYNLHIEDGVVYGFVSEKPTRIKVQGEHISGSAAERDLMLTVKQTGTETEVAGLIGGGRVVAVVSEHNIKVNSVRGALRLSRERGNRLTGQLGLSTDLSPAELVTRGCDLSLLRERPYLIVVLLMWWMA